MPLITIRSSVDLPDPQRTALLKDCSHQLAATLGKPESYVMTLYGRVAAMTMGGTDAPACLVEIKSVGSLSPTQTRTLSQQFCELLQARLGVSSKRIYLNFVAVDGAMWGFDGDTFG